MVSPPCLLIVQGLQLAGPVSLGEFGRSGAASVCVNSLYPLSVPFPLQTGIPAHVSTPLSLQAALDLSSPGQSLSQLGAKRLDLPLQVLELPLPHAGLSGPAAQGRQHQASGGQRGNGAPVDVEANLRRGGETPQAQPQPSEAEPRAADHTRPAAHRGGVCAQAVAVEGLQVEVHTFLLGLMGR